LNSAKSKSPMEMQKGGVKRKTWGIAIARNKWRKSNPPN
jgi:hypothetical protein